jgi:hypothetical protein
MKIYGKSQIKEAVPTEPVVSARMNEVASRIRINRRIPSIASDLEGDI